MEAADPDADTVRSASGPLSPKANAAAVGASYEQAKMEAVLTKAIAAEEKIGMAEPEALAGLHESQREPHGGPEALIEEPMARRDRGCHQLVQRLRA